MLRPAPPIRWTTAAAPSLAASRRTSVRTDSQRWPPSGPETKLHSQARGHMRPRGAADHRWRCRVPPARPASRRVDERPPPLHRLIAPLSPGVGVPDQEGRPVRSELVEGGRPPLDRLAVGSRPRAGGHGTDGAARTRAAEWLLISSSSSTQRVGRETATGAQLLHASRHRPASERGRRFVPDANQLEVRVAQERERGCRSRHPGARRHPWPRSRAPPPVRRAAASGSATAMTRWSMALGMDRMLRGLW